MKNRWKINEKSTKNRSWRRPGASLGRLGCLNAVLGRLGGVFDRPGSVLERLGGVPAASWGVLGALWWPTWLPQGRQNETKIHKKSKQKSMEILISPGIGFLKDFGRFWTENQSKVAPEIQQNLTQI